jgi:ankyrin repeat protein
LQGQLKDPDVGRRDADDEDNSITLWDLKIASKRKLKSMSLVDYAINHWHYHAQRAKEDFVPDVMRAFGSTQKFLSMVKLSYFLTDELSWHIGEQNLKTVSPCHLAAWYGLTKFILHLVAHGFSSTLVDDHNRQPLSWAVKRGYIDTVELLLRQRGTELNLKDAEDEFTPLARATNLGHLAVVNLLLTQSDIEVNCTNSSGTPPLSLAAKERHPEIVQCLLQRKDIDLNVRDNRDMTPLLHAVKEQREDRLVGVKDRQVAAVTFLLEHPEVNVNVQGGYEGRTVLMYAMPIADTQSRHIAELLLDMSKLDMNLRNKKGESVLIFAIWRGRANELSLLLDKRGDDIDLACENYEGKTALAIARDLHHNAELIVRMLYQFASCQKKEEAAKRPRSVRRAGRLMSELNHKGLQKLLDREHDNIDIDREIRWTFFKEKPPSRLDEGETLRAAADRVARDELNKVNILTEFIRRRTATAPDKEGEATKPDQELRFGE